MAATVTPHYACVLLLLLLKTFKTATSVIDAINVYDKAFR